MANKFTDVVFDIIPGRVSVGAEELEISSTDKLVLLVIARRLNGNNECWPGYGRMAKDAGVHRSTAIASVNKLVQYRILSKECGVRSSNTYHVNFERCCIAANWSEEKVAAVEARENKRLASSPDRAAGRKSFEVEDEQL